MTQPVRRGLFRTTLPGIGECARVDMRAGDAAPYLERDMYVMLGFDPPFDLLPREAEQAGRSSGMASRRTRGARSPAGASL